ncbi:TetR/AcrR family transcriptional regulator [Solimonas sp. K1W22B-7]|uniref:TetR/AcrR family transcriptional regulator n=1 Tax=Solimonas sp. K1W22B-7 TaxID=2303331 RepID=UPI0013C3F1C5|nr:TetR/AcrR family transcriptional regulator [Solimonas sp. K1W22B-7]
MPRKPQQPRARATVDAIIEAGFRCVARDGLADTSVRQIIETAGVSPGSFYEYFENKEAVFKAMLERFVTEAMDVVEPMTSTVVQMSIEDLIRTLLARFHELLLRDDSLYLKCAREGADVYSKELLDPAARLLQAIVYQHALNHPDAVRIRDLQTMVYIFVNGGIGLLLRFLTDANPPISFERFSEGLAHMVGHFVVQETRLRAEQEAQAR